METGDCYLRVAPPSVRSRRIRHVEVLLCVAFGCVEIHFVVHFLTWFPRDGHLIYSSLSNRGWSEIGETIEKIQKTLCRAMIR